jgi:SOS response regulatory protein OraA/RecX
MAKTEEEIQATLERERKIQEAHDRYVRLTRDLAKQLMEEGFAWEEIHEALEFADDEFDEEIAFSDELNPGSKESNSQ